MGSPWLSEQSKPLNTSWKAAYDLVYHFFSLVSNLSPWSSTLSYFPFPKAYSNCLSFPSPSLYLQLLSTPRSPSDLSLDSIPLGSLLCLPHTIRTGVTLCISTSPYTLLIRLFNYNCLLNQLFLQQNYMLSKTRIIFYLLFVVSISIGA
jgi:hypothetical protein